MPKPRILIQLDCDPQPSTFDAIVAIDAGVEHLLRHSSVNRDGVESLIHGAMFTRGGDDLKSTALFVGGSDISSAEAITKTIDKTFFGPVRVSYMADPNGANTTAAAAVLSAEKHLDWKDKTISILGGTGPVGQRIGQIIGGQIEQLKTQSRIRVLSRSVDKAKSVCARLTELCRIDCFEPVEADTPSANLSVISGSHVVFAAGAAGIQVLEESWLLSDPPPLVAIDLNAVPPVGIAGIEVFDQGQLKSSTICYGAIGVGSLKMKIHKRCVQSLFESNGQRLLVDEIYLLGKQLLH